MTNILITDLMPAGSGLFSDFENLIDSMQNLSENELKMTFGGKYGGSKSSKSKKSKSSYSYSGGCGGGSNVGPNA